MIWDDAKRHCLGLGGYLVSTTTLDRVREVIALPRFVQAEEYWIGLRSSYNEGDETHYWSDGSTNEDWRVYSYPRYINSADPHFSKTAREDSESNEEGGGGANYVPRCAKMYKDGIKMAPNCIESHYFICKIPSKWHFFHR